MTLPPLSPNAWLRWDVVSRLLPDRPGDVLEIGCGQGSMGARIAERSLTYLGVEPDPTSCTTARTRIHGPGREVRHGLAPDVLDDGATFDVICAFEVLEHLEDDLGALTTWSDLLRPGGLLVLSTPAFAHRYGPSDAMAGHYRRYDPDVMRARLTEAGLVQATTAVYGAGLGHVLEAVRHQVGARRLKAAGLPVPARGVPADLASEAMAELTAGSGRLLQPPPAAAIAVQVGTAPFRRLQRAFPAAGTGLVATARRAA